MIRPALGEGAFHAELMRKLCLDDFGRAVFDDSPEAWTEDIEPTLCRLAEMRVTLLSTSVDETRTRAVFEIEAFPVDSPMGPTRPRMGDLIALQIGVSLQQTYRVEMTHGEVLAGVDADLGPNELLLSLHAIFGDID